MDTGRKNKLYKGSWDCFNKMVKEEGIKGLFKGSLSNILKGVGASLVLVLYDDLK